MPLILPGNVASATAGGYEVANSCRFNYADSPLLSKDQSTSPTNADKFTISFWTKLGLHSSDSHFIFGGDDANNRAYIYTVSDKLELVGKTGGTAYSVVTTQVFRDPSAWMNIIYAVDTTQSTDTNRVKLYINGTQVTSFQLQLIQLKIWI